MSNWKITKNKIEQLCPPYQHDFLNLGNYYVVLGGYVTKVYNSKFYFEERTQPGDKKSFWIFETSFKLKVRSYERLPFGKSFFKIFESGNSPYFLFFNTVESSLIELRCQNTFYYALEFDTAPPKIIEEHPENMEEDSDRYLIQIAEQKEILSKLKHRN